MSAIFTQPTLPVQRHETPAPVITYGTAGDEDAPSVPSWQHITVVNRGGRQNQLWKHKTTGELRWVAL